MVWRAGHKKGILSFEDFTLALIIMFIAVSIIVSNLFIFDHSANEAAKAVRAEWNGDSTADMIAKQYVDAHGNVDLGLLDRELPGTMEISLASARFGATPPVGTNLYVSRRIVIVNGTASLMIVGTW